MRGKDWNMAIAARNHWLGKEAPPDLCPLIANLDGLISYLDEICLRPGHAIAQCQKCGQEHRWSFIRELMVHALDMRPASQSTLLEKVDKLLEPERASYGGKEGYLQMRKEAAAYFSKVAPLMEKPKVWPQEVRTHKKTLLEVEGKSGANKQ